MCFVFGGISALARASQTEISAGPVRSRKPGRGLDTLIPLSLRSSQLRVLRRFISKQPTLGIGQVHFRLVLPPNRISLFAIFLRSFFELRCSAVCSRWMARLLCPYLPRLFSSTYFFICIRTPAGILDNRIRLRIMLEGPTRLFLCKNAQATLRDRPRTAAWLAAVSQPATIKALWILEICNACLAFCFSYARTLFFIVPPPKAVAS